MKIFKNYVILFLTFGFLCSCGKPEQKEDAARVKQIWKGKPQQVLTKEEINEEIKEKTERVVKFLNENNLDAVLLTQVRNFSWITAGAAHNQIVLNKDNGAATIMITKNGDKYLLCSGSEAGRLMDESLGALGYKALVYNWYESNPVKDTRADFVKGIVPGKYGSDVDFPGAVNIAEKFRPLRYSLTGTEIKKYKWLAKESTEAIEKIAREVKPGMDEFEIEAMTSAELRSRGIMPTVLLTAVDDRIYKYRHALPGGAKLKKYAMINIVAEKWGMPAAVTRFVHFGELPDELKLKLEMTAIVNAHYQEASKPGKSMAEIFEECKEWYAQAGFKDEWLKHHQGGPIGYDDREYVIYPGVSGTVQNNQALAWNPTITGAKIEDTIIASENGFEVVTKTGNWPNIIVKLNGKEYPQPSILIRDINTGEVVDKGDYILE